MPVAPAKGYQQLFEMLSGTTFHLNGSAEAVAEECPFCGGARFYLNVEKGVWDCKKGGCRKQGNHVDFIRFVYRDCLAQTTDEHYRWLKEKRGVSLQTLKRHGLAFDAARGRWLIPFKNAEGDVVNLQLYVQTTGMKLNLPGLETALYGFDQLSKEKTKILFLCEGAFDAIALDHHLKQNRSKYDILAMPGTFKDGWGEHFRGRKVRALFDNDDGGRQHGKRVQKLLGESGIAADLRLLRWPDGFPKGFDINDLVRDRPEISVVGFVKDNSIKVEPEPKLIFQFGRRSQNETQKVDWPWPNRLRCGTYASFSGPMGTLKSTIMQEIAARYSRGRSMPTCKEPGMPAGHVLYVYVEDDREAVENGFEWAGGDFEKWIAMPAVIKSGDPLNVLDHLGEIEQTIREHCVRLVIIDGQNSVVGAPDISTDMKARNNISNRLHQFAQKLNVCLIGIRNEDAEGRALGAQSMGDIGRCVLRAVELEPVGKDRFFKLIFRKVSDVAKSKYPDIPYSVKDHGGSRREILWEKSRVNAVAEALRKSKEQHGTKNRV